MFAYKIRFGGNGCAFPTLGKVSPAMKRMNSILGWMSTGAFVLNLNVEIFSQWSASQKMIEYCSIRKMQKVAPSGLARFGEGPVAALKTAWATAEATNGWDTDINDSAE